MNNERKTVTVYLEIDVIRALYQYAATGMMSKSTAAAKIIRETLIQRGFLRGEKNEMEII